MKESERECTLVGIISLIVIMICMFLIGMVIGSRFL